MKEQIPWQSLIKDTLSVRVTPRASANRIKAEEQPDGALLLRVYVTTVPENGKANEAVIALLAKELGLAKSALTITHGVTDRNKIIRIKR